MVAIKEINKHTELDVWYKEQKKGRSITGFEIYWNKGQVIQKATQKQVDYIKSSVDYVIDNTFNYVQIKNDNNRIRAFEVIGEMKRYKAFVIEPINIDTNKAHEVIGEIDDKIDQSNSFTGNDKPKRDTSSYYNWLDKEEE